MSDSEAELLIHEVEIVETVDNFFDFSALEEKDIDPIEDVFDY